MASGIRPPGGGGLGLSGGVAVWLLCVALAIFLALRVFWLPRTHLLQAIS